MLRKSFISLSLWLFSATALFAETLSLAIEVPATAAYEGINLFASPAVSSSQRNRNIALERNGNVFSGEIPVSPEGIYILSMSGKNIQTSQPFYFPEAKEAVVKLTDGNQLSFNNSLTDATNRAFGSFQNVTVNSGKHIGMDAGKMTPAEIKEVLLHYAVAADSLIAADGLEGIPAQYLRLWAYTSASDSYNTAGYLAGRAGNKLNFAKEDIIAPAEQVLDTPMATWFYSTPLTVSESVTGKTPEAQLASLYEKYSTPEIRKAATGLIMDRFLNGFDYNGSFDSGMARLVDMSARYNLPDSYMKTFRGRRATVPGAAFPEGIRLLDRDGNEVDFAKFKGKNVYVDVWASWCGPCVGEVPHLQKLEKELEGSNVEFVSISVDTDDESWKERMEKLNMHGNQLIDADHTLGDKLNVRSIPHFMIYDADGKLVEYKTLRPSHTRIKEKLQNLK